MKPVKILFFFFSLCFANLLMAHPGHSGDPGFTQGFLHPLSGFDHFLVILLVGFWSVFVLKNFWLGPLIFMVGMIFGVFLGLTDLNIEWLELGISISVMALGLFIFLKKKLDLRMSLFLIGIFGAFHGLAHVQYLNFMHSGFIYQSLEDLSGLLLATFTLHLLGAAIAKISKHQISIVSQGAGSIAFIYGLILTARLI
jgi:urease accessory protein